MSADPVTADVAAPHRARTADSAPGELPRGWAWTTTAELVDFVTSGSRGWAQYYSDEGATFIRIGNLDRNTIALDLAKIQRVKPPKGAEGTRTRVRSGDILISITAELGLVALVPDAAGEAYINQHIALARPNDTRISKYLAWYLASDAHGKRQLSELQRGATKAGLGLDDIRAVRVPLPPLAEQRRIVAAIEQQFTRLDAGVTALRRAQAALKRYRAAVLKAAVEGRLTDDWRRAHPDAEPAATLLARILAERRARWEADLRAKGKDPARTRYPEPAAPDTAGLPALPDGWCWAAPEQLASTDKYALGIGPFGSNLKVEDYRDEGVPLVFVRNIRSGIFDGPDTRFVSQTKADELRAHMVMAGDLLITKMGDPPGDACSYPNSRPLGIITADCVRWRLSLPLRETRYFVYAINSSPTRAQILTITKGVAQLKVSLERFKRIGVPLPPLAEQQAIVAEVERRLSVVAELETAVAANLARAERLRQAILREAFAGRLVPQDPDDEPATALLERIRRGRNTDGRDAVDGREMSRGSGGDMHETRALGSAEAVATKPIQERLW